MAAYHWQLVCKDLIYILYEAEIFTVVAKLKASPLIMSKVDAWAGLHEVIKGVN